MAGKHEHALVAGAVLADEAGSVEAEQNRHVVLADVVDEAVVGALAEGRVERHHGRMPASARPAAMVTACGSAMPTSWKRAGKCSRSGRGRCRSACRP